MKQRQRTIGDPGTPRNEGSRVSRFFPKVGFHFWSVVPAVVLLVVVVGFASAEVVRLTFTETSTLDMRTSEFVGLDTITRVSTDSSTVNALTNSLQWIFGTAIFTTLLGVGAGQLLSGSSRLVRFSRGFMLVPWVLPGVVVASFWKWAYNAQVGVVNDLLVRAGILESGHSFLGDPRTAMPTVVSVMVWRLFPIFALIVAAAIQTVDTSIFEAATVDGANSWQRFVWLTLPLIKFHIATMTLLTTIWVTNNLVIVQLMTGGGPAGATDILPVQLFRLAFQRFSLSDSAVISVINVILLMTVSALYLRVLAKAREVA